MVWYITCHVMLRYITCYVMLCYVTVQLVQKGQCNGKSRPKAADIVEVMVKLQRDGFGQLTKSVPITVFLKELPCDVSY